LVGQGMHPWSLALYDDGRDINEDMHIWVMILKMFALVMSMTKSYFTSYLDPTFAKVFVWEICFNRKVEQILTLKTFNLICVQNWEPTVPWEEKAVMGRA
jgi:hypothetical protein